MIYWNLNPIEHIFGGVGNIEKKNFKRFKVKIDPNKPLPKPKPSSILKVLEKSQSSEYDIAKTEWQPLDIIDETSEGFTNICGLCSNPHLKANFIIMNPHTEARLHVGSTCIIRFGLISGNVDISSGAAIINTFIDEKSLLDEIRGLTRSVMVIRPEYELLNRFLKVTKQYLNIRGIKEPTINQLGEMAYGERWGLVSKEKFEPNWLHNIYYHPYTIDAVKTKKVSKLPQYKEGTTWGHKKRKGAFITDTFGRSESYNVEKHVVDKIDKSS